MCDLYLEEGKPIRIYIREPQNVKDLKWTLKIIYFHPALVIDRDTSCQTILLKDSSNSILSLLFC